jgi:phosphinothricin acetyltransferase
VKERDYEIRDGGDADLPAITALFNYFVRESFAAFPDREVAAEAFMQLFQQIRHFCFPVVEVNGQVIGFGMLRPLYPHENMHICGEVSYFIAPEYTHMGIGRALLESLTVRAKILGMTSLVAKISSENGQSLSFHGKHGFHECGKIEQAGRKFGRIFHIITMQKFI